MIANIQPQTGFGRTAQKVNVAIEGYTLGGDRCKVVVNFLDAGGNFVARNEFVLAGAAYEAWGSDDFYIVEVASQTCGFVVL